MAQRDNVVLKAVFRDWLKWVGRHLRVAQRWEVSSIPDLKMAHKREFVRG